MNEDQSRKRNLVFLIVGVLVLLLAIVGATYAFFQAQIGTGKEINADVSTGTTDNLTFSMSDINRNVDPNKETNVLDEENEKTDIIINANQKNFGSSNTSLGDGVKATATLKANDTTNNAIATYNVFFVMDNNNLKYTTDDSKPELILTIIDPNGNEITSGVPGLKYHTADSSNPNDVSGFDITGKTKAFAIAQGYTIEAKAEEGGKKEQTWQIKVTLVNLKEDQNDNTDKEITGRVVITTGTEKDVYTLPHINTITSKTTTGSIDATLNITQGTNEIKTYYFAIEEKGKVEKAALSEKSKEEIKVWETEETNHHVFNELEDNTNYIVYSYVVDSEGFESELYGTELISTDIKLPSITSVQITNKTYNSISISVTTERGSFDIIEYEYAIKKTAGSEEPIKETTRSTTHTFNNLEELTEYTILVKVKDIQNNYSAEYIPKNVTTNKKTIGEVCKGKEFANCIKENYELDSSIIYHNLADATEKGFTNYNLVADDNSYRYTGANDIVNNYVCLDGNTNDGSCDSENDLYRIIGIFKNETTNDYEIKLVKYVYATTTELGNNGAKLYADDIAYGWNLSKGNSYESENTNNWRDSNLNKTNLNSYYYNYLIAKVDGLEKYIANHIWITGGVPSTTATAKTILDNEVGKNRLTVGSSGCLNNVCTKEDVTYPYDGMDENAITKIGLIYISDYAYSAYSDAWNQDLDDVEGEGYLSNEVKNNNWLFKTITWTITRLMNSELVFNVYNLGGVNGNSVVNFNYVYPVFYLKSITTLSNGEGTISNPYHLSLD